MAAEPPDEVVESLHRLETRIIRIGLVLVALAALAAALLWLIFVRAPPPRAVCQHLEELTVEAAAQRDADAGAALDGLRMRCLDNEERRIRLRGRLVYKERARCVMSATTLDEAERC